VLDERFNELPGYIAAECVGPDKSGFRQSVKWGSREQITSSQPIRIRVDFTGPAVAELKLFAVYLDTEK